jgi:hypothetical protein
VVAEPPRGGDEPALVTVRAAVDSQVAVADPDWECPDGLSRLDGVFRQVRGYLGCSRSQPRVVPGPYRNSSVTPGLLHASLKDRQRHQV